ncbi:MAG TPA: sulfatase-like hydrolase/transferase [Bryobacteraceae bacterium]|nr:sulfatase-like hydrolase/transferase [Bryobacteraceae bacterium]
MKEESLDGTRRDFLRTVTPAAAIATVGATEAVGQGQVSRPNVLFLMADQFRFDAIRSLGNPDVYTPNIDRLAKRGVTFTNAYSQCPVCVPSRYSIRTGCEPPTTRVFFNGFSKPLEGQSPTMTGRCGPYLADTMTRFGYRTFGIGKFHTSPWDEKLGYGVHLHSEELYSTADQRNRDSFAAWIRTKHPPYNFIEGLMGERTEMYYMPQMSPMPAEVTVERWAAEEAIEQIRVRDAEPYFGFVSFIGPHPPFAPPIPFNRLYNPDRMPNPVLGDLEMDHMDEQIPWMNYAIWAEDVNDSHARVLRARYYGEITYIDDCIGRILDAVEARGDADNTLICFFSDHGDHLGDHHAWQKETYFEASCHIPFLVSWPGRIPAGERRDALVTLTDLFGIATSASGTPEFRQGTDALGVIAGTAKPREHVFGYYGEPGTPLFKIMVRHAEWKYIFFSNGGREQLFHVSEDPHELHNRATSDLDVARTLRGHAAHACDTPEARLALNGSDLRAFPFRARPLRRIYQFDRSRGVTGFPARPEDVLKGWPV